MDLDWTILQEHLGVQATRSQGHPSGLPGHSSAQRQEPPRGALLQGRAFGFSTESQKTDPQATGEPALLMGISVLFSIWDALNSSRLLFCQIQVSRASTFLTGKTVASLVGGS